MASRFILKLLPFDMENCCAAAAVQAAESERRAPRLDSAAIGWSGDDEREARDAIEFSKKEIRLAVLSRALLTPVFAEI
jgi:hypothetical protein